MLAGGDMTMGTDRQLPAWGRNLLARLDEADSRASAVARSLSIDQLNWQPHAESWSVGQCLDHLRVSNDVYVASMAEALDGRSVDGPVDAIVPGWFGRWFIRTQVAPSSSRRGRAPRKIVPVSRVEADILARFLMSNETARLFVRRAAAFDVNRIRFRNPFVPLIRFTVGTGLEILTQHEARHLLQAERVRAAAGFPG
jgi:DinB superfamily